MLIDIDTFNKMEELLENYGLGKHMEEVKSEETFTLKNAKRYYYAGCLSQKN